MKLNVYNDRQKVKSYPVKHICPPFKSDTLEDCEKGKSEIVKVGDPVVGALPVLATDLTGRLVALVVAAAQRWGVLVYHLTYNERIGTLDVLLLYCLR